MEEEAPVKLSKKELLKVRFSYTQPLFVSLNTLTPLCQLQKKESQQAKKQEAEEQEDWRKFDDKGTLADFLCLSPINVYLLARKPQPNENAK